MLYEDYNIDKTDVIEYFNDEIILYEIYKLFDPIFIYLNSYNKKYFHLINNIDRNKIILETYKLYDDYYLFGEIIPDIVLSNDISNEYFKKYKVKPLIQQLILPNIDEILQKSNHTVNTIQNNFGSINLNNINIGIYENDIKSINLEIFIQLAKYFKLHNFIWIGSSKNDSYILNNIKNIYHIPENNNLYKYYKNILDYILIFNTSYTYPYYLLENILLETNIIVIQPNILYNLNDSLIKHFYFEYINEINSDNAINAIKLFVKNKKYVDLKNIYEKNGYKYIKNYFFNPDTSLDKINEKIRSFIILNKSDEIICSYISPDYSISTYKEVFQEFDLLKLQNENICTNNFIESGINDHNIIPNINKDTNLKKIILILLHIEYDNFIDFYIKIINYIIHNIKFSFKIIITINENLEYLNIKNNVLNKIENLYLSINITKKNVGEDIKSYIDFILDNNDDYDYLIKMHDTKSAYSNFLLNSIFMNIEYLINIFENNSNIGIIGHYKYLKPLFYGLSKTYINKLNTILQKFNINENINIDYLNIQNNKYVPSKFSFNEVKKYLDYNKDLFDNYSYKNLYKNFINKKKKNLCNTIYNINNEEYIKVIEGNIFIIKGIINKEIYKKYKTKLYFLKDKIEKNKNYDKYDNKNNKIFNYINSSEYILQSIIYNFGYKIFGIDNNDILSTSLYLKNYNLLNFSNTIFSQKSEITKKEINPIISNKKILFISNELTNKNPSNLLRLIIEYLFKNYDIYLLSYKGGDQLIEFEKILGKNNIYIIYKNNEEYGFEHFFYLSNICKNICDKINPDIVYINTLQSVFGIYGSYNKIRNIILYIYETEQDIINLYNKNLIIGYDYLKYVNHLIFINENTYELFKNNSYYLPKYDIIYNDVNIDIIESNVTKEYFINIKDIDINIDFSKKIIGGAGSFSYNKGFDIFIKLANLYINDFIFLWTTNTFYNNEFGKIPNNLFIINCDKKEMPIFYKIIDLFLHTSKYDNFPITYWESLLSKKYAIKSNITIKGNNNLFQDIITDELNEFSNINLYISFLDKIKHNNIDLNIYNNSINIEYIKELCNNNITKIEIIIKKYTYEKNNILINLKYPDEFTLYKKLNIPQRILSYGLNNNLQFNNFNENLDHYIKYGFTNGYNLYKFPCLIKKRVLFVLDSLLDNEKTRTGLNIAYKLQQNFDIIIISWEDGLAINDYKFENKNIIIKYKYPEYNLINYLERVELAKNIINNLLPDLVYINSSKVHDFYHAASKLNIPNIYHNYEDLEEFENEFNNFEIPIKEFCKYYDIYNSIYYSYSNKTTQCMIQLLNVPYNKIREFQIVDLNNINILTNKINYENNKLNFKNKKRLLIGMYGLPTNDNGYNMFLELADIFKEYDFCWIGANIEKEIEISNNLILIRSINNSYLYIKEFDYFLFTCKEQLFPKILSISLYLNIPTFYVKSTNYSDDFFKKYGAISIDKKYNIDTFIEIINNLNEYILENKKNINIKNMENELSINTHINIIIDDIYRLTNGILRKNKIDNYYYDEKYGYITYDFNEIDEIISKFHKIDEYDYEIYKNKYNDLSIVLHTEEDYYNHWINVGYKNRNMNKDDWKLYIALNINLLKNKIDSKEELDDNYKNIVFNFDIYKYINKYKDINESYKNDIVSLYNHFENFGCLEGKISI